MDLDDDELEATKDGMRRVYSVIYDELCRYMDLYNKAEERIKELEEELKKYKKEDENKLTRKEISDMIIEMLE